MRARYHFTLPFDVRDYECDLQGIVNNAVYQQYLEHTRHRFLQTSGVSFAELTQQGINVVVFRAELDYKHPLRSGDTFTIGVRLERLSPVRFAFLQDLYLTTGGQELLSLTAKIVCAAMNRTGKPIMPMVLEPLLARLANPSNIFPARAPGHKLQGAA